MEHLMLPSSILIALIAEEMMEVQMMGLLLINVPLRLLDRAAHLELIEEVNCVVQRGVPVVGTSSLR